MKRKGFTLIELLAVIVILAIIALIATPIIMNMIENSRKGAAERTADNYFDAVEVAVGTERVDGRVLEGIYTIQEDGNLCPKAGCGDNNSDKVKINMNGNKPSSGTIVIENGLVTTNSTMTIGDYTVSYDADKKAYEASKVVNEIDDTPSYICEKTGEASKTVGAQYKCNVATPEEDTTFYVLENIESSENISLIMDRNFTDEVVPKTLAWCIDGGRNGETCKNINSKEEGTPLNHIQDTFGDSVEVSFPTYDQITTANNGSGSNLPQWLYDYLDGTANPVSEVYGYWTDSINPNTYNLQARRAGYQGYIDGIHVYMDFATGVRPVITIPKDQLD